MTLLDCTFETSVKGLFPRPTWGTILWPMLEKCCLSESRHALFGSQQRRRQQHDSRFTVGDAGLSKGATASLALRKQAHLVADFSTSWEIAGLRTRLEND